MYQNKTSRLCVSIVEGGTVVKTTRAQFEAVYQAHRVAIYHTALSFLRDPSSAEDVMHDVFLTYYEHLQNGTPIHNLRAWLLTVTRNRCRNALRSGGREISEENPPTPCLEDPTVRLQEQDAVDRLLSCLTEDERLVFSLHYLDGYTYRELSEGLEIPIGTIQTRCHMARKKLKRALKTT